MIERRWAALFGLLAAALTCGVVRYGATLQNDWNVCVAILALAAVLYSFFPAPKGLPPPGPWLKWPMALFLCYVAFQVLPLPVGMLGLLSPSRMRVLEALAAVGRQSDYAAISVAPSLTFTYIVRTASYATLFLLIRALAWNWIRQPWRLAFPLMALGTLEAALGLLQYGMFDAEAAHGTYVNRNHFAGLLEMALPFFVMYAAVLFRRKTGGMWPIGSTAKAYAVLLLAAMILLSLIYSLSRMGFASSSGSMLVLFFLTKQGTWSRAKKMGVALALLALLPLSVMLLSPARMVQRFAQRAANGEPGTESRPRLWADTLHLIRDYPAVGCGLGAFGNAFPKYQTVSPGWTYTHAHNDYLQLTAELGLAGALLPAAFMAAVYVRAWRATSARYGHRVRYLAIACAGALTALALHSLTDFNTYIPANAMALTWISGIASVLPDSRTGEESTSLRRPASMESSGD